MSGQPPSCGCGNPDCCTCKQFAALYAWLTPQLAAIYQYAYAAWWCCQQGCGMKIGSVTSAVVAETHTVAGQLGKEKGLTSVVSYIVPTSLTGTLGKEKRLTSVVQYTPPIP